MIVPKTGEPLVIPSVSSPAPMEVCGWTPTGVEKVWSDHLGLVYPGWSESQTREVSEIMSQMGFARVSSKYVILRTQEVLQATKQMALGGGLVFYST